MTIPTYSFPVRLPRFARLLLLLGAGATLALTGCAHRGADSIADPDLTLSLTLAPPPQQSAYLPGDALVCSVALGNRSNQDLTVATVDHESLVFTLIPAEEGGLSQATFKQPVFSEQAPAGQWTTLDAGSTVTRTLLFTNVTFYPGRYLLACHYQMPDATTPGASRRVFARSAPFTVADAEPSIRRYLNGLMAREEAVDRAAEAQGGDARQAQARLILDERGFHMWWVNVPVDEGTDGETVRSCFVDPYFGNVYQATHAFQEEDADVPMPYPDDSLRRQRYSGEQ